MKITQVDMAPSATSQQKSISEATEHLAKRVLDGEHFATDYMIVVDLCEPSYRKRLYLVNKITLLIKECHHVTHGSGSSMPADRAYVRRTSNKNNSHMSSRGSMKTGDVYHGKHGRSLRLMGLEKGLNDNVESRAIVIHPADYVTDNYILRNGRAGESWGCLAVDPAISDNLINKVKGGAFVYVYF